MTCASYKNSHAKKYFLHFFLHTQCSFFSQAYVMIMVVSHHTYIHTTRVVSEKCAGTAISLT